MIISSNYQSVIVGFLCECDSAKNYSDNTWVNITGKITKGSYHGDMPIVKVTEIKTTDKPNDEYVYPPDETYIPTRRKNTPYNPILWILSVLCYIHFKF